MKNKLAAIEGILFSMGTSVTRRQLMEALEIDDEQFDELIKLLQIEYDKGNSPATSTRCSSPMRARFIPCLSI